MLSEREIEQYESELRTLTETLLSECGGFNVASVAGEWSVDTGKARTSATNKSLLTAMREAVRLSKIPVVRRRPVQVAYEVKRFEDAWAIFPTGSEFPLIVNLPRFEAAKAAAQRLTQSDAADRSEWDLRHKWIEGKCEGVDFHYE